MHLTAQNYLDALSFIDFQLAGKYFMLLRRFPADLNFAFTVWCAKLF